MHRVLLICLTVLCCVTPVRADEPPASAQSIDPHHFEVSGLGTTVDIASTWLLQQGDDPSYADTNLDDSRWLVVESDKPLKSYGLRDIDFVWYRLHVHIPMYRDKLGLSLNNFGGSYDIFVNGTHIGSSGNFPAGGDQTSGEYAIRSYELPDSLRCDLGKPCDLLIAFRASLGRSSRRGTVPAGFRDGSLLLGNPKQLAEDASFTYMRVFGSRGISVLLQCLLLMLACSFAVTLRSQHEYLAIVVYAACLLVGNATTLNLFFSRNPDSMWSLLGNQLDIALAAIAMLEFTRIVLNLSRTRLLIAYEFLIVVWLVAIPVVRTNFWGISHANLRAVLFYSLGAVLLPYHIGLPFVALWRWRKTGSRDALLLAGQLLIQGFYATFFLIDSLLFYTLHITKTSHGNAILIYDFVIGKYEVSDFTAVITLMFFIVMRTLRTARARAAVDAEIQAARTVQQVLLRSISQSTPGFCVESVYHPASEVGGDFFLISPDLDGSLIAIVGDVSGKGLMAAMRVSMILGVLRREDSRDPATVLHRLNEALLNQGQMGFTTACCVRIEHSGEYNIANAGHIAPYIGGAELLTAPSLPLGLAGEQDYEMTRGMLGIGKMVLMSDGVVEARTAKGELYGFDRLAPLSLKSAAEIADTALEFGQEDDITVLTIALCAP